MSGNIITQNVYIPFAEIVSLTEEDFEKVLIQLVEKEIPKRSYIRELESYKPVRVLKDGKIEVEVTGTLVQAY